MKSARLVRYSLVLAMLLLMNDASASVGQEQACAGRIAESRNIRMSEVRVLRTNGSESGIVQIEMAYPGGSATCWVDRDFKIHDIHWNAHSEHRGRSDDHPTGNIDAQEQACASRMADEVNERMSAIRVAHSIPYMYGSRQVTVTSPGMRALCTADVRNNVVFFKFLPAD